MTREIAAVIIPAPAELREEDDDFPQVTSEGRGSPLPWEEEELGAGEHLPASCLPLVFFVPPVLMIGCRTNTKVHCLSSNPLDTASVRNKAMERQARSSLDSGRPLFGC